MIDWVFLNPPDAVEESLGPAVLCSLSDLVCPFFLIAAGFTQNIFDGLPMMCSFDIAILSKNPTSLMYAA